ncbi:MAG: Crp/Fnr family transcriptional regulator [Alphaproteobacteria bacterium]
MKNKTAGILELVTAGTGGSELLKALREDDLMLLLPQLRHKTAEKGVVLYKAGDPVEYAYFPLGSALVSFMVFLEDDRGVEATVIGREGAAGGIVSQGHLPAYCQSLVQSGGGIVYISCAELQRAKEKSPTLNHFFARYADCLLAQIFQAVACNATHSIEQRVAKWLLAAHDRVGEPVLLMTQDNLAGLLGVGRSYVAKVMNRMKKEGVLQISRGRLTILDAGKLKKHACGCDQLVRAHFADVLPGSYKGAGKRR